MAVSDQFDDFEDDSEDSEESESGRDSDRRDGLKPLRAKARKYDEAVARADKADARAATLERRLAAVEAGVDVKSPTGKLFLDAVASQDIKPEDIPAKAAEYGLITVVDEVPGEEIAAHGQIAAASAGATPAPSSVLTPDDVNDWPIDKLMRFRQSHPKEFEALKRGESVNAAF